MKLCPACDRHLFGPEPSCPFCGAAQGTTVARLGGTAMASVTLAFALATAACGPVVEPEQTDGSSTAADDDTTVPPSTTTTTTATTTPVDPSTDDGSAMTTIGSTTAEDDTTDEGGGSFYAVRPDGGGLQFDCDVLAQDCPPGDKCMPWADDGSNTWNATRCAPIANDPDAPGEPCTVEGSPASGIDSCELGAMCFHVDPETFEGTCVAMCTGTPMSPQCEAPEQACLIANDGVLALCLDTCDPLAPACDPGMGCYPSGLGDDFFCLPTAEVPGTQGQPCEGLATCDPGLVCLDAAAFPDCAGLACCTEYCDTSAGLPCPGAAEGVVCQPWYEDGMAPPGLETVGVCTLPL